MGQTCKESLEQGKIVIQEIFKLACINCWLVFFPFCIWLCKFMLISHHNLDVVTKDSTHTHTVHVTQINTFVSRKYKMWNLLVFVCW